MMASDNPRPVIIVSNPRGPASRAARLGCGVVLPTILFVIYQILLLVSLDSGGGWDGIGIAFGSLIVVPGLLIANCWTLFLPWQRKSTLFFAGTALPALVSVMELLMVHGPYRIRWAINAAFVAPFVWLWLFAIILFTPLGYLTWRAIMRRNQERRQVPGTS